ncbi:hypothetical protein thsps117_12450 [Pseudomonas sp. No.117]
MKSGEKRAAVWAVSRSLTATWERGESVSMRKVSRPYRSLTIARFAPGIQLPTVSWLCGRDPGLKADALALW